MLTVLAKKGREARYAHWKQRGGGENGGSRSGE